MVIIAVFLLCFMVIVKIAPFGDYSFGNTDCFHQMFPLLAVLQRKLKNGESLLYYWNSGAGSDFISSYYYYLASPLNLLVVFIDKSDLNSFISLTIALRIIFSAVFFGLFITNYDNKIINKKAEDYNHKNDIFYISLSCAYALCNYFCAYMYEIMWLDSLMVFPLILLGYYKMIKEKKPLIYVISLAYSLYCNYYLSYMICLFLILWFLLDNHDTFKVFLNRSIYFVGYSFLSAGLVAFQLIFSFTGLMNTVSNSRENVNHFWYGNIFNIIRQQFIFSNTIITSYDDYDVNIYCGIFVLALLFIYIFISEISVLSKVKRIAIIFLFYISFNESILNYVWHGMHIQHGVPNRFAFILIMILLITAKDTYDGLQGSNIKLCIIGIIGMWILPLLCYFFVDFNSKFSAPVIIFVSYIFIFLYTIFISMILFNVKNQLTIKSVFSVICILEILVNACTTLSSNLLKTDNVMIFLNGVESVYTNVENSDTDLFYRSDRADGMTDNENAYYGMNGLGVFNSTINKEIPDFLNSMGQHTWKNRIAYSKTTEFINDLMGIKYIYGITGNDDYEDNENYEKIYNDGIVAYQNKNALPLGFAVREDILKYKKLSDIKVSENLNSFATSLSSCNEILIEENPDYTINYSGCDLSLRSDNDLSFSYTNRKDEDKKITIEYSIDHSCDYYIDIREDNEDYITIMINDVTLDESIWLTNGLCRLGHLSENDKVRVIISDNKSTYYQKNSSEAMVNIYLYSMNNSSLNRYIEECRTNIMQINDFSDAKIDAEIEISDKNVLFTTIPFDEGWHIYCDGKEIKTIKIADAFLGIKLEKGKHTISFVYKPRYMLLGVIILMISIMIIVILFVNRIKLCNKES